LIDDFQKNVYTFFEALAVCHTVQVAGSYSEEDDREEEELNLLRVEAEIPPIFHKSMDELHEIERIEEEADYLSQAASQRISTINGNNGHALNGDVRPFSDLVMQRNFERSHHRPLSLSNIQVPATPNASVTSLINPDNPPKQVDFVRDPSLISRIKQLEFRRNFSHQDTSPVDDVDMQKAAELLTHRRSKSHIPLGSKGESRCAIV